VADRQALSVPASRRQKLARPALEGALAARSRELLARYRQAGGGSVGLEEGEVAYVFACSEFVAASAERDPALLESLSASGELGRPREDGEIEALALGLLRQHDDEPAFMSALRRLRRREMVRIAWRDLAGGAPLAGTLGELSSLADAAIRTALAFAVRTLTPRFGLPRSRAGEPLGLVVLGMGKLGGGELNFSSDIDLVFLYPEAGETDGHKAIANEEYFTRLGQALIRLLDAPTVDGFVFRVDLRLRPFGESGPLVASFGALEDYLQQHGRDWERYAYVKARAITGSDRYAELFEEVVRPFVYRRYLDFGVFESLREMKDMIAREVIQRELQDNVKLGPGGIREIEFVVQSLQLIRAGSDRRLQTPSLLTALPRLEGAKLLDPVAVRSLGECYDFLRRVENRLQMLDDAQTHSLPEDDSGRERLAVAMGLDGWPALQHALEAVRGRVSAQFRDVVLGPGHVPGEARPAGIAALWTMEPDRARLAEDLRRPGLADPAGIAEQLLELRGSSYFGRLDEHGRKRLAVLLPRMLAAIAADPGDTPGSTLAGDRAASQAALLRRLRSIVESIGGRTAYLALLNENPAALARLVEVCRHGDFLARQVAAFPILLDELIDARVFETLPDRPQFGRELDARLEHAGGDLERQIDALRHFRRAARFRVALLDLTDRLSLMRVSDRLTDVAELVLERAMRMAWDQVVAVHGEPRCGPPSLQRPAGLAAVGYGKLGGWELGYSSDLDLVFLHDSEGEFQQTAGPKVVDNAVFFTRFGQRLVHLLTVHTAAGRLYEVDMRLRPSGKGGLTVTHVRAFEEYQKQEAWTWEHQALLHSRSVAGSVGLREEFERIRRDVLMHNIRRDSLRGDVRSMRERMRAELGRGGQGEFDLKQDPGGIADIEFLSQYWVLRWAGEYPPLCLYSDTIRQLESVGSAALVDHGVIDVLVDAYRVFRQVAHRLSLEESPPVTAAAPFAAQRQQVLQVWDQVMVAGDEPAPV
jgi:glutamate-ammonia-ligase adenylyltransferase